MSHPEQASNLHISVVVPSYNEVESLTELSEWIDRVMQENNFSYEVIFVDDGSTDGSWQLIESLAAKNGSIKGVKFRRNYGKSAALNVGFEMTRGQVVITMDADLQDSPEEIPGLYQMIMEDDYDLVSGWKKKRYDPLTKTIPTKFFNAATRRLSGISLHDFNCGLKAYKGAVVHNIEVYGEMHRYIPVIAKWAGFKNIGEKVVQHQERKYGVTKFGLERFINGFLDLMSITFVTRFGKKPMHFFGAIGTLLFFIGTVAIVWILGGKLYHLLCDLPARLVTEQPAFYIALTCMILGTQLFLAGFLAELISRNNPNRNNYQIEKEV